MTRLETAILTALTAHKGQVDEDDQPHIIHSLEVMFAVKEATEIGRSFNFEFMQKMGFETNVTAIPEQLVQDLMVAAVLHDVSEDTTHSIEDIRKEFGNFVADTVDGVTRRHSDPDCHLLNCQKHAKEFYRDFIYRAAEKPASKLLKRTDLLVNLRRTHKISPKKAKWRDKLEYKYGIALRVLDSPEPTTWEKVSWELNTTKVDGDWAQKFFMADPNGKKIEVTQAEVDAIR